MPKTQKQHYLSTGLGGVEVDLAHKRGIKWGKWSGWDEWLKSDGLSRTQASIIMAWKTIHV